MDTAERVVLGGELPRRPYMATAAKTENWCTPEALVRFVRQVFGGEIDCDPCANPWSIVRPRREIMLPEWQEAVKDDKQQGFGFAERTVEFGDGLLLPWGELNFFNPPYSARLLTRFMGRAHHLATTREERPASSIMLGPSKTSLKGWHAHVTGAQAVLFLDRRVEFIVPGPNKETSTAPFHSCLVLWSPSRELVHRFAYYADGKLGQVMVPA